MKKHTGANMRRLSMLAGCFLIMALSILGCGADEHHLPVISQLNTPVKSITQSINTATLTDETAKVINGLRTDLGINKLVIKNITLTRSWIWVQIELKDEAIPLRIDVVSTIGRLAKKILYMLPGTALNFESNFFVPREQNLAHFMREQGYLIIGISPREDNLLPTSNDPFLANWGLAKHKQDIRKVISLVNRFLHMPYDLLGHSGGAMHALDYAATYTDRLGKIMVMDIDGQYDPINEPNEVAMAQATTAAYQTILDSGSYSLDAFNSIKELMAAASLYPQGDSGVPRPVGGNFTFEGLVYFSLIYTGFLPGYTTPYTGLPDQWYYTQGLCAGYYDFAEDPTQDTYGLSKSTLAVVQLALAAINSGIDTTAHLRDLLSVSAGGPYYTINWSNINEKVVWINTDLGFGAHTYAVDQIRQGGNTQVTYTVVPEYGHADPVFGPTAARQEFWPLLLQ